MISPFIVDVKLNLQYLGFIYKKKHVVSVSLISRGSFTSLHFWALKLAVSQFYVAKVYTQQVAAISRHKRPEKGAGFSPGFFL